MKSEVRLQVLICTYGVDGIRRVAECRHEAVDGVEYIVAWQMPDDDVMLPEELQRPDFKIVRTATKGLSRNRNIALDAATAPLLLISDDDVTYPEGALARLIDEFDRRPEADFITFMYDGGGWQRDYPDHEFDFNHVPKGYYVTSFELALRRERISGMRFNEWFGIGAPYFPCGEEDIFIYDITHKGLRGVFLPITLASHRHSTTTDRIGATPPALAAGGAVTMRLSPLTWPARLIWRALRGATNGASPMRFLTSSFYGAYYALRHRVFYKIIVDT